MSSVIVLVATYNGEKYIRAQLDSILNQSYSNFSILVSDDHSTDSTWPILQEYAMRFPAKIRIRQSKNRHGNAKDHFLELVAISDADWMFFSDQDDVWLPDKMEIFISEINKAEQKYGSASPITIYSDQIPTDEALKPLASSLVEYQQQNPHISTFKELTFQNVVIGGAMAINKAAAIKSKQCSNQSEVEMHDWWLAMICSRFGHCIYIGKQLSLYRQHGSNEVGASNVHSLSYKIKKLLTLASVQSKIRKDKLQANAFADSYKAELVEAEYKFLKTYAKKHSGFLFYFRNRRYINGFFRFWGHAILG